MPLPCYLQNLFRGQYLKCAQAPRGPAATVPPGILVSPSANVDSGTHPAARDAAQGEAVTILAQGPPLLVHSGEVHLQQAWRGRLQAALLPDASSPPGGGERADTRGAARG